MELSAVFLARLELLHSMLFWIEKQLAPIGFEKATIRKVELASEEALVNIIRHAYKQGAGQIQIQVKIYPKSHVEIAIHDQGPPFNPLEEERTIDSSIPLEERQEGGLGILLIRKYMDDVLYQRTGDVNILTLIKKV